MAQTYYDIEGCNCDDIYIPASQTAVSCEESIKQGIRLACASLDAAEPFAADGTDIEVLGTWTAAKAALSPDTLWLTKNFVSFTITDGAVISVAGGTNDTEFGAEQPQGHATQKINFTFQNLTDVQRQDLHTWFACNSRGFKFALITANGKVIVRGNSTDTTNRLFRCVSAKMQATNTNGLNAPDTYVCQLEVTTVEFEHREQFDISAFFQTV